MLQVAATVLLDNYGFGAQHVAENIFVQTALGLAPDPPLDLDCATAEFLVSSPGEAADYKRLDLAGCPVLDLLVPAEEEASEQNTATLES